MAILSLDSFYPRPKRRQEKQGHSYIEYDNAYITNDELLRLTSDYETLSRRIANFINYLNKKDFKGNKFKKVQE